jgi:hypothetical protein
MLSIVCFTLQCIPKVPACALPCEGTTLLSHIGHSRQAGLHHCNELDLPTYSCQMQQPFQLGTRSSHFNWAQSVFGQLDAVGTARACGSEF